VLALPTLDGCVKVSRVELKPWRPLAAPLPTHRDGPRAALGAFSSYRFGRVLSLPIGETQAVFPARQAGGHSKKETFVDDGTDNDMLEDEANKFAREILIPPDRAERLRMLTTDADVEKFAHDIGVAPGIVVGRMHHDKIWEYTRGNRLKRSLRIIEN
jgi:hypothetical protein